MTKRRITVWMGKEGMQLASSEVRVESIAVVIEEVERGIVLVS